MRIGVALLLLVALTHYGYDPIAHWIYTDATRAAKAIFYVLRGFEAAALWAVVLVYAPRSWPLVVACAWGFVESAQTSVCRLALGIGGPAPAVPAFGGLCDLVGGHPVAAITGIGALVAVSIVQEVLNDKGG